MEDSESRWGKPLRTYSVPVRQTFITQVLVPSLFGVAVLLCLSLLALGFQLYRMSQKPFEMAVLDDGSALTCTYNPLTNRIEAPGPNESLTRKVQ